MKTNTSTTSLQTAWAVAELIDKSVIEELAKVHYWPTRDMGPGEMIDAPVTLGEWRYKPLDYSTLTGSKKERVDLILKSCQETGKVAYFIWGDELEHSKPLINIPWDKIVKAALSTLAVAVGAMFVSIAAAFVVAMIAPVILVAGAIFTLAMVDPNIVVVVQGKEGPEWVEIWRELSDHSSEISFRSPHEG